MQKSPNLKPWKIKKKDAKALAKLQSEYQSHPWSANDFASFLDNKSFFGWAIGPCEEPQGYILLQGDDQGCDMVMLLVSQIKRHQGLASALLNQLFTSYRGEVFLEVSENNVPALAFYKKHQFVEVGRRENYYRDTSAAILMRCANKMGPNGLHNV